MCVSFAVLRYLKFTDFNFYMIVFLYRKSPPKTKDVSNSKKVTTVLAKPSGPSRAEAKFDYTGERDDDLTFKVCM